MSNSFVAFDFETANRFRQSACSIGLRRVVDGKLDAPLSTLIKPADEFYFFEPYNVFLHGITEQNVKNAPTIAQAWPEIQAFIGDLPLVAHNAAFDASVLYRSLESHEIKLDSITTLCTRNISRLAFPGLASYALADLCEMLGIDLENHHDALADADAAAHLALILTQKLNTPSLSDYLHQFSPSVSNSSGFRFNKHSYPRVSEVVLSDEQKTRLSGKKFVFTLRLESLQRSDAEDWVRAMGGKISGSVSSKTDYLVVGSGDIPSKTLMGTTKAKDAQKEKENGSLIEVISEGDFLELISID